MRTSVTNAHNNLQTNWANVFEISGGITQWNRLRIGSKSTVGWPSGKVSRKMNRGIIMVLNLYTYHVYSREISNKKDDAYRSFHEFEIAVLRHNHFARKKNKMTKISWNSLELSNFKYEFFVENCIAAFPFYAIDATLRYYVTCHVWASSPIIHGWITSCCRWKTFEKLFRNYVCVCVLARGCAKSQDPCLKCRFNKWMMNWRILHINTMTKTSNAILPYQPHALICTSAVIHMLPALARVCVWMCTRRMQHKQFVIKLIVPNVCTNGSGPEISTTSQSTLEQKIIHRFTSNMMNIMTVCVCVFGWVREN